MLKFIKWFLIVFLFNYFCIFEGNAAIINAKSCSQPDIQSAINSAGNGDTVTVPAGSCTWTSVTINAKAVTLQGAGIGSTIITGNGNGALAITAHATLNTKIAGFTFLDAASQTWYPTISVSGAYSNTGTVRITGNQFTTSSYTILAFGDNQAVLLDNNNFTIGGSSAIEVIHLYGDGASWTRSDNFGSGTGQVIMEDNTFDATTNTSGGWALVFTSFDGARMTVRHNILKRCYIDGHPNTWAHDYGVRQLELYSNSFINGQARITDWKAGTAVIYSNTWDSTQKITLHAPTLFYGDNSGNCCCTSNLTTVGCRQRPGMGYNYGADPIYIWSNTDNSPTLIDYDIATCDTICGGRQSTSNAIRSGTEYITGSSKPGYTAYTYPHPLNTDLKSPSPPQKPSPPQNLRITQQ